MRKLLAFLIVASFLTLVLGVLYAVPFPSADGPTARTSDVFEFDAARAVNNARNIASAANVRGQATAPSRPTGDSGQQPATRGAATARTTPDAGRGAAVTPETDGTTVSRAAVIRGIQGQPAGRTPGAAVDPVQRATGQPVQPRAAVTQGVVRGDAAARPTAARAPGQPVQSRAAVTQGVVRGDVAAGRPTMGTNQALRSRAAANQSIMGRGTAGTTRTANAAAGNVSRARAATQNRIVPGGALGGAYILCRDTYVACMDEFCANRDTALRRCACSSRVNDFEDDRRALEQAQSQLADFQERLLAVNMDAADAEAMFHETHGERAWNQPDTSSSQQRLNEIFGRINADIAEARDNQTLARFQFQSVNMADMFDTIDTSLGEEITLLLGESLFRAALPKCLEIAREVCDGDDLRIVQSAYHMMIEQDCNTVSRNFDTMRQTALDRTRDASALLDMSRLANHQDRNSGEIASCTAAMMEIINSDAVCGQGLGRCLDWSGRYINPLTGEAILTNRLSELQSLLTRPTTRSQTWGNISGNAGMVRFLESKRTYIEPAMRNCEMLGEAVWNNFIEDALSSIKLAQDRKIEEMRQACTRLVFQCQHESLESIRDFDVRAASVFQIAANVTAQRMCSDIHMGCTALMRETHEGSVGEDWGDSITDINLINAYHAIMQNCRLVGQECIRLQCQTQDEQFGLCVSNTARQRRNILSTDLEPQGNFCYNQVKNCVRSNFRNEDLNEMVRLFPQDFPTMNRLPNVSRAYWWDSATPVCGVVNMEDSFSVGTWILPSGNRECPDWNYLEKEYNSPDFGLQMITRNIWGRCLFHTTVAIRDNRICERENCTTDGDLLNTVLAWFDRGTGRQPDGCNTGVCDTGQLTFDNRQGGSECTSRGSSAYEFCGSDFEPLTYICDLRCPCGYVWEEPRCIRDEAFCRREECQAARNRALMLNIGTNSLEDHFFLRYGNAGTIFTNCCFSGEKDDFGNCCQSLDGRRGIRVRVNVPNSTPAALDAPCGANQCCFEVRTVPVDDSEWPFPVPPSFPQLQGPNRGEDMHLCSFVINGIPRPMNYIATRGDKHLFCMGELRVTPSIINNNPICNGALVTVDMKTGIYNSGFTNTAANSVAEKVFLNYVYINSNNDRDATSEHNLLFFRVPNCAPTLSNAEECWVNSYFESPDRVVIARLQQIQNCISGIAPSGSESPCGRTNYDTSVIGHSVAFCEKGFSIQGGRRIICNL